MSVLIAICALTDLQVAGLLGALALAMWLEAPKCGTCGSRRHAQVLDLPLYVCRRCGETIEMNPEEN